MEDKLRHHLRLMLGIKPKLMRVVEAEAPNLSISNQGLELPK